MKQSVRILCLLLALMVLVGCTPSGSNISESTAPENSGAALEVLPSETTPASAERTEQALAQIHALGTSPDDNYRVWYEIFVYSFCDSDGDGIGDLQGVISKLDYLQELGINGIWFMPIHPSQSYHKYDVANYYEIDPQYGTMADFEQLMAECEKRDIHVITDLVINHTGDDNVWFLNAVDYLKTLPAGAEADPAECKYVNYYFFSKEPGSGWHAIEGTEWYYEGTFSPDMPDLDLSNPDVLADLTDVMQFWIDKGVAGFRLDAAKEFYSGQTSKNVEVLNWIQTTASSLKEVGDLVAEVWEEFGALTQYYESGIISLFNFAFANTSGKVMQVVRGAGNANMVGSYAKALETADTAFLGSNPNYIDAPFLSNHDIGRIAGFCGYDEYKTKLAGAMNLFMSGSAFIYYGEEIGMVGSGNDPSKRAPFVWNDARDNGTTNPPPECELPEAYPFGSLEAQRDDDESLYNYYRQAIAIRQALPVLSHGRTTAEIDLNVGCISAFRKTWNDESVIVLMNIDPNAAQVDLSSYAEWELAASLSANGENIAMNGTTLDLPAFGVAVLRPAA